MAKYLIIAKSSYSSIKILKKSFNLKKLILKL